MTESPRNPCCFLFFIAEEGSEKAAEAYLGSPIFVKRKQQGCYNNLVQELRLTDPQSHFRYTGLAIMVKIIDIYFS